MAIAQFGLFRWGGEHAQRSQSGPDAIYTLFDWLNMLTVQFNLDESPLNGPTKTGLLALRTVLQVGL